MNDRVTKNYSKDGGDTLVIGGKLVIEEGAEVEGMRRLCAPELFAGYHAGGFDAVAGHVSLLALHGSDGVAVALTDGDGIGDDGRGHQGTDAVVDEDDGVEGR